MQNSAKQSVVQGACAIVLLTSLLSSTVMAQGVTVEGKVHGAGGPKQFASIKLDGPGHYVAATDADGTFKIPNVIPGKYTVEVRKEDHRDVSTHDVGASPIDVQVPW